MQKASRLVAAYLCIAILHTNQAAAMNVRVATWNLFDLPESLFPVASATRIEHIAASLQQKFAPFEALDAIVLTELYVAQDRNRLLAAFASLGMPHHVQLTGKDPRDIIAMPGLVVVSRWPIDRTDSTVFRHVCHGFDCFTTKGTVYAKLSKMNNGRVEPIHLFGVHFYVGKTGSHLQARRRQAEALKRFVQKQVPQESGGIVIMAGDLNAPWTDDGPHLLGYLKNHPILPSGPLDHTFVGQGHFLSGNPRQSIAERCQHSEIMTPPNHQEGRKWIDYVVSLTPGQAPLHSTMRVIDRSNAPYMFGSEASAHCQAEALSDHYPVIGEFLFP